MDIDDSYFESEEQACSGSESKKQKERESYCARRCELGWFLEEPFPINKSSEISSLGCNCECPKDQPQGSTDDFMLLKYRADLCYSLKEFSSAAGLFEQVLELLPPLNAMVKREVLDSLARCYDHLGQHNLAQERAKQIILPPYDSDASSWKLLSQCQKSAGNYEDHMISLQKCVSMERQHADFWMALADGYRLLQVTYSGLLQSTSSSSTAPNSDDDSGTSANVKQLNVSEQLGDILSNTVSLFRPYFSWRDITNQPDAIKMKQLLITDNELLTSDEPNLPASCENTANMKSDQQSVSTECHKNCPFFIQSQKITESNSYSCLYQTVVGGVTTPNLLALCLLHSPFVILASRQVTVGQFVELLKNVAKSRSIELLSSFYTMAECSCYLWARQLLLYSARYSSSFAKVAMTARLEELEKKLSAFDQDIRTFLQQHFTQRTIFEGVSNHSSRSSVSNKQS